MHHAELIDTKSANAIELAERASRDFIATGDDDRGYIFTLETQLFLKDVSNIPLISTWLIR